MEIIEPAQEESVPTSTSISISVGSSSAAHARNEIRVRICLFTKLLPEPNQLKAARVAIERMLVLRTRHVGLRCRDPRTAGISRRLGTSTSRSVGLRRTPVRQSRAVKPKGASISHRQYNLALKSFRAPVKARLALQLASNNAVHHARAEALTRGWLARRATHLGPAEEEASV